MAHVLGLVVCHRNKAPAALDQCTEQLGQRGRRLFVRQRNDRVADAAAGGVDVAELAGLQRLVAVCHADAAGLEACGQVGQGPRINELTQNACGRAAEAADHVSQAKAVEPKAGQELVMYKIWYGFPRRIVLQIVAADGQNLVAGLVNRHNVGQFDPGRFAVGAHVLEPVEVQFDMHFQDDTHVVAVRGARDTLDLVHLLTDLIFVLIPTRCQVNVAVEPRNLELAHVVVGHLQDVRDPRCTEQVRCRVWHDHILGRDELSHRPLLVVVEVELLERRPGEREIEEHLVRIRIVLVHAVHDQIVHVVFDPLGLLEALGGVLADDLRLYRAAGRQDLFVGLGLKLGDAFRDEGVRDARCALKRCRALLRLDTQQIEALGVGLFPVLPGRKVVLVGADQITGDLTKRVVLQELGEVGVERDELLFRHALRHHAGQSLNHGPTILHLGYLSAALEIHRGVHGNVNAQSVLRISRALLSFDHVAEGLWR